MTGPQKARLRKEQKQFFEVLNSLPEEHLRVIIKYLDHCAIDHIGSLVYNLTQFENNNLTKRDKKKLYKCLIGNTKLAYYLAKPSNNFEKKKKIVTIGRVLDRSTFSGNSHSCRNHCQPTLIN